MKKEIVLFKWKRSDKRLLQRGAYVRFTALHGDSYGKWEEGGDDGGGRMEERHEEDDTMFKWDGIKEEEMILLSSVSSVCE